MPKPIMIVCSHCGSDRVMRDAWAEWNPDTQDWELQIVFDQGFCNKCGGEATLNEVSLTDHKEIEEKANA